MLEVFLIFMCFFLKYNLQPGKWSLSLWNEEGRPPDTVPPVAASTSMSIIPTLGKQFAKQNLNIKALHGHLNRISQLRRYLDSCYSVI